MPPQNPSDVGTKDEPNHKKKHHDSGGSSSGGQSAGGGYTARTWAEALLSKLGFETTDANVRAIVSWEQAEGGHWENTATYNPLNTTQDAAGATSMNSVGVKAYTSWEQGLDATAQTLQNGYYTGILGALRAGHDPGRVLNAVVASPWSSYGNGIQLVGSSDSYGTGAGHTGMAAASGHVSARHYVSNNVESQYGYLSAYLHDPEIGPIIRKAAQAGWSETRLLSALEKTDWWKHTSQTAREQQALQRTDPATYRQNFQQTRSQVGALAKSMGLNINDQRLDHIATTALWSGWSNLQIQQAVGAEFHYNPDKSYKGSAGSTIQKFKAMANQYLVPLGDHAIEHWTRQSLEGKINPDDYSGYLAEQAKTLFPWMSKQIDNGTSPQQFLDPYRQSASQTLELNPADIDFTQHKWRHLFEQVDPKTGDRSERGLSNAMSLMRTDPRYGYDFTDGARNEAASLASSIASAFGFSS